MNRAAVSETTQLVAILGILPWESRSGLYEVKLASGDSAFMRVRGSSYANTDRMVVIVDAERLLACWRADRHGLHVSEANGSPETWIHDRKFSDAADGFKHGSENPVPLATVGCCLQLAEQAPIEKSFFQRLWLRRREMEAKGARSEPVVHFTNGITRTMWLLVHGAKSFPVECGSGEAGLLAGACGVPFASPQSVYDITRTQDIED